MSEKSINVRAIQKHDTSANWAKAVNFVPKDGEIIIYDDLHKIKIGDGTTLVSNLPFAIGELPNTVTGATKCKITYNAKGLVTAGENLTSSDIPALNASKINAGTFADARIASAATWNAKYDKPADGIPKTDLASDVQTSLGKADTALQEDDIHMSAFQLGEAGSGDFAIAVSDPTGEVQFVQDNGSVIVGNVTSTSPYSTVVTLDLNSETKNKINNAIQSNAAITGATKCKITYDSKGLVTAGADLAASDIPNLNASKITAGTFADARIASASTWNAKLSKVNTWSDIDDDGTAESGTDYSLQYLLRTKVDTASFYVDDANNTYIDFDTITYYGQPGTSYTVDEKKLFSNDGDIITSRNADGSLKPIIITSLKNKINGATQKYTATNSSMSVSSGTCTWSIPAATHALANNALTIQVYEVSTGKMVLPDITVNQSNYNVTIEFASTATIAAGTYRVVITG